MQQNDLLTTPKVDAARSEAAAEAPEPGLTRRAMNCHPWLLEYFEVKCRAKKVVDANPDLYPVTDLSPERRYTSRKLNMTPLERKRLADGIRAARREIRAVYDPYVRR